jgi:hypothetical protein
VTILEDPRLALLGVDDEVLRLAGRRPARRPLHGRLEVRPAAARQAGGAHLLDHRLGPTVVQRARECRVGAVPERVGDVVRVGHPAALEQYTPLWGHELPAHRDLALGCATAQRVEQLRHRGWGHRPGRQALSTVAQHLDDRLRPAHAVAAGRDDAERQAPPLRLRLQRRERLGGTDGKAAGAEPHRQARSGATPLGLALERREACPG